MAKKDKNNQQNIHYSRTMTSDNLSRAANYVGKYVLKGLGTFGKIVTAPFTQQGPTSATIYKSKEQLAKERTINQKSEEQLGKAMTWMSPLNYGAAIATGNGLNAPKGEEVVASWSPAWQALGRAGELYFGPKAVKGVKNTPKTIVNTAAKAGNKTAKKAVIAREIKQNVKNNNPNTIDIFPGQIGWVPSTVFKGYHASESQMLVPNFWYKGWAQKTHNAPYGFYAAKGSSPKGGFLIKRPYVYQTEITFDKPMVQVGDIPSSGKNILRNYIERTAQQQGADGIIYQNIADNQLSHQTIAKTLNPDTQVKVTLGRFSDLQQPFKPSKLKEPSTSLKFFERGPSTIQISPEQLYKALKDQEQNGYYFMGHGTGRSNVNPQVIFDNGLRIKHGDIGNTTSPISESNLSVWPHANSKEIIILPGKADNVKFDSAHGRIPSDWYDSKTFQWEDNPGFEGSGFFAVQKPNATFIETEINGVPGVYTKPEAILGSYNVDTHTLRLNPRSQYKIFKEKQGGKMNLIEFLKNGSGIHIKKKNRGKFTEYCGGKVTSECIARGKNSSNPTIRKRATFAANARKWKHRSGGILKAQLGLGLTQFNDPENPNAMGGDIVNSYIRNQLMIPYLQAQKEAYEKWKLQMKQQSNTQKSSLFDNLLNTGLSIGTDYLKSKLGI